MSDRELIHLTDFTALMATRKYEKVPVGHPYGSLLGVRFLVSTQQLRLSSSDSQLPIFHDSDLRDYFPYTNGIDDYAQKTILLRCAT